jgi:DNA processing protein
MLLDFKFTVYRNFLRLYQKCYNLHMNTRVLSFDEFPPLLKEIPDPPRELYFSGTLPSPSCILIAVVGSRKYTEYGRRAAESIIAGLRGYDIAIVSGLAFGIDAIAHRTALKYGIPTIGIPGSGLDPSHIYPRAHRGLAEEIMKKGGALFSEYEDDAKVYPSNFPARNRIMAGMSVATVIIEAKERSGSLITARLALEYNRDVFAVPGSIFSDSSAGTNTLIRDGASPVQSAGDIIEELHLVKLPEERNTSEETTLRENLVFEGESISRDAFFKLFENAHKAQLALSRLELSDKITIKGDIIYKK